MPRERRDAFGCLIFQSTTLSRGKSVIFKRSVRRHRHPAADPARQLYAAAARLCFAAFFCIPLTFLGVLFLVRGIGQPSRDQSAPGEPGTTGLSVQVMDDGVLAGLREPPVAAPELSLDVLHDLRTGPVRDLCFVPADEPGRLPRLMVLLDKALLEVAPDGESVSHPFNARRMWNYDPFLQAYELDGQWRLAALAVDPVALTIMDLQGSILASSPVSTFGSFMPPRTGWGPPKQGLTLSVRRSGEGQPLLFLHSGVEPGTECFGPDGAQRWYYRTSQDGPDSTIVGVWAPVPGQSKDDVVLLASGGYRFTLPSDGSSSPTLVQDIPEYRALLASQYYQSFSLPLSALVWPPLQPGEALPTIEQLAGATPRATPDAALLQTDFGSALSRVALRVSMNSTCENSQIVDSEGRTVGMVSQFGGVAGTSAHRSYSFADPGSEFPHLELDFPGRLIRYDGGMVDFEFIGPRESPTRLVSPTSQLDFAEVFLLPDGALIALSVKSPDGVLLLRVTEPAPEAAP
ncbi:MAG: hypothetical protein PWP23_3062 [Candidatus Sumerlaeota bacterium]|nr:hypothetical protein [Candidatus Sumerlaeota bacterium]